MVRCKTEGVPLVTKITDISNTEIHDSRQNAFDLFVSQCERAKATELPKLCYILMYMCYKIQFQILRKFYC